MSVLRAGESNVALFRDIHATLRLVVSMLEADNRYSSNTTSSSTSSGSSSSSAVYCGVIDSLAALAAFESGMNVDCASLLADCRAIMRLIEDTVDVYNAHEALATTTSTTATSGSASASSSSVSGDNTVASDDDEGEASQSAAPVRLD